MPSSIKYYPRLRTFTFYSGVAMVLFTIVPFITIEHWSVRAFDFPHIQLMLFTGLLLVLRIVFLTGKKRNGYIFTATLSICFLFQVWKIRPYTIFGTFEVKNASKGAGQTFSIYTSNVYQENMKKANVVNDTKKFDADIVLYTETDADWIGFLNKELENVYRYRIKVPKDNTYGMALYSKFKLEDGKVMYMVEDSIPSIHARVVLPNKKRIQLYAIHPAPPTPMHNPMSLDRDAELMKVARLSKVSEHPIVVMGDFNDVAWSETTSLFQSYSGLLDLRKGRGLFNTYNANYWFVRWPLDHVFVSPEFRVLEVGLGDDVGSDHFPFYTRLSLEPQKAYRQKLPLPSEETVEDALEQIKEEQKQDSMDKKE